MRHDRDIDLPSRLAEALGREISPDEKIAVGVSGGPDSVALLLLAAAAFPGRTTALTVDHGLRPASAAEAAEVATQCLARGIPHVTLYWTGQKPGSNLQAAARTARYALMADWCAANRVPLLFTAHHADDQAETLLIRLARASGGAGLSGIRIRRNLGQGVTLVRPLLGIRRNDLSVGDWPAIDDPSNRDPRFARTHARRLLAETDWLDVPRLADTAAHLADTEAAIAWATDRAWAGNVVVGDKTITIDPAGLPHALQHRLVARAMLALSPSRSVRGPAIDRLIARISRESPATLAGVRASGGRLWHFKLAPERRQIEAE